MYNNLKGQQHSRERGPWAKPLASEDAWYRSIQNKQFLARANTSYIVWHVAKLELEHVCIIIGLMEIKLYKSR